jgi:hydrogenase/urease accessory protein HupE
MGEAVYLLCALTSLGCAFLLVRSYRQNRTKLLLWSSVCFVGLAINNALLFIDLVAVPSVDLSFLRATTGLAAVIALLVGLIWSDVAR